MLPLILLWSFVACLSICSDHCTEAAGDVAELTSQVVNPHEAEGCPIPAGSFLISRRSAIAVPQINTEVHAFARTMAEGPKPIGQTPHSISSLSNLPSLTDPPLKRLGALRI